MAANYVLAGCACIDFNKPKLQSTAISPPVTADSTLGPALDGLAGANRGNAGFYTLPNGIDTQYYPIANDPVGRLLVEFLLRAADHGGRNIADEYFAARPDSNSWDLDVIGIGPIVTDVSSMFDEYWNSRRAVSVTAFADPPDDPEKALADLRERLRQSRSDASNTRYAAALGSYSVTSTNRPGYLSAPVFIELRM